MDAKPEATGATGRPHRESNCRFLGYNSGRFGADLKEIPFDR